MVRSRQFYTNERKVVSVFWLSLMKYDLHVLCFGAERERIQRKQASNSYCCMWEDNRSTWQCVIISIPCNRFLIKVLPNSFYFLFISQQHIKKKVHSSHLVFLLFQLHHASFVFVLGFLILYIVSSPYTNCISCYIIMLWWFRYRWLNWMLCKLNLPFLIQKGT